MKEEIHLKTPHITLGQLLKIADLVSSGSPLTKMSLAYSCKNHFACPPENRRGRKLYPGDSVEIKDQGSYLLKES